MFTSRFSTRLILVLTTGALFMGSPVRAQDKTDKTAELKNLLKERSDLLNKTVKNALAQYELGIVNITEVLLLQRDSMKAGAELDGPKERLASLRLSVELAQKFGRVVKGRKDAGVAKQLDMDHAMAAILDARIELLREEQRQTPVKPGK